MMYLNPDRMTREERQRVDRWLEANGARWYAALEPIIVRGRWIEFTPSLPRKLDLWDTSSGWFRDTWTRVPDPAMHLGYRWEVRARRRQHLRIRLPLADID